MAEDQKTKENKEKKFKLDLARQIYIESVSNRINSSDSGMTQKIYKEYAKQSLKAADSFLEAYRNK